MKRLFLLLLAMLMATGVYAEEDVKFKDYITDAFQNGLITGNEKGDFESGKTATRAEFITMTAKFFDLEPGCVEFSDVKKGDWFYESITTAASNGIIAGYPDGTFKPGGYITCQEAVTIIGRYYKLTDTKGKLDGVSGYAAPYYSYAVKNDLFVEMTPEYTAPQHYMTKGELLVLLYKYHSENLSKIRFLSGYPKISDTGRFGSITVSVMTNRPCKVYYGVHPVGETHTGADTLLCEVAYGNSEVKASVMLNLNEKYDIHLRAVLDSGEASKVASIKSVMPFSFTKGNGTKENPYIIYTEQQLNQIRQYPDKAYILESDIAITGVWNAIDDFSGVLDGNGHKISGVVIGGENENQGLFSSIDGAAIKNLSVSADVSGKRNIGIIAGHIKDSVVENCIVEGFVSAKTNSTGGICGVNEGTIRNCVAVMYSTASSSFAGGITGQNFGEISNCLVATDMVASDMYAGAIAGTNQGGKISNCVFAGQNVYDTMTHSSGRITTNRNNGLVLNNYFYAGAATNIEYVAPDKDTPSGMDIEFQSLVDMDFYINELGWKRREWEFSENGFRFPCPAGISPPEPERGRMMCMPHLIKTASDFKKIDEDPKAHYALANDIYLSGSWKGLCMMEGFSGSLDGRGYTIHNLRLGSQDGLFSNISGGTVRNLKIKDARSDTTSDGAIISGCNFGYIENCTVSAVIKTKKAGAISIITLENYGEIKNCDIYGDLTTGNDNAVIGGICANNSGRITNCYFRGTITATGDNAVIGGISGCDDGGYVFENRTDLRVMSQNMGSYVGGICGIAIGTQVYKNSSSGTLSSYCDDYSYIGGICGSLQNALIYNCYSSCEVFAESQWGYIGGVCGCASESNVQSSYSTAGLFSQGVDNVYTGGICGYAEGSFIMQNVALNPVINAKTNVGAVYGGYTMSEVEDNYSIDRMLINSRLIQNGGANCKVKSIQALQNKDFYFKPVAQGGVLGWGNIYSGEDIWMAPSGKYPYPVLSNVKNQESIKTPTYK